YFPKPDRFRVPTRLGAYGLAGLLACSPNVQAAIDVQQQPMEAQVQLASTKETALNYRKFVEATNPVVQERTISGQILTSDENSPLPGVNIAVKGSTRGTTSDAEGKFRIAVPDNNAVLVFSSVGFL